jgi:hypothetical protein
MIYLVPNLENAETCLAGRQVRSTNIEARNKFKIPKNKIQNKELANE